MLVKRAIIEQYLTKHRSSAAADAREILGQNYSNASEYQRILAEISPSGEPRGASCGVERHRMTRYRCPMHLDMLQETPGICAECGMTLVPHQRCKRGTSRIHWHAINDQHAPTGMHIGHRPASLLRKFLISFGLTIPILTYSDFYPTLFGAALPKPPGLNFVLLALASAVFFYGGGVFMRGAWHELRARLPGMMTLIAIAISAGYLFSVFQTFRNAPETLFWELSTLITIMLLGHWIEMRSVQGAHGALRELAKLLPDTAEVLRNGMPIALPLEELRVGDTVIVRPGAKVPADGVILEGRSDLNESILTGESRLIPKGIGDEVIAGSINGDGSIMVRVSKVGGETFLAGVMRLVAEAQASKSRLQILSDTAAYYLTLIAVGAGAITFLGWLISGSSFAFATERMVAVLVIACPHALGLAVPLVAAISTTMAARSGFLVKQRRALEAARDVNVVLFDKTGTLTKGEFGITSVIPAEGIAETDVLRLAAAVDSKSEHPLARAIVAGTREQDIKLPETASFERIPGKGAVATVGHARIAVGNEMLLTELNVDIPEPHRRRVAAQARKANTVIHVVSDQTLLGSIALADVIRLESKEAIATLKSFGIKVGMVTGDADDVASWVARELGLDQYFARVLPSEKAEKIRLLQEAGEKVAMVGDGVNDAPALTQADLGIAIGAGTNVAIESAGIILVRNDPRDIPKIIRLSRLTYAKMLQNLFWATGYNVIALPLAAGALAAKNILLDPTIAAILMSLSTIVVAVNAVLLRRVDLASESNNSPLQIFHKRYNRSYGEQS